MDIRNSMILTQYCEKSVEEIIKLQGVITSPNTRKTWQQIKRELRIAGRLYLTK